MTRRPSSWRPGPRSSFTMVELLMVLAVGAIITGMAIAVFLQTAQASVLTTTSDMVLDQLNYARQEAQSLNRRVEVRFYELPLPNNPSTSVYRAIQSFVINESNTATNALSRPMFFASQVELASSATFSTLLSSSRSDTYPGTGAIAQVPLANVGLNYTYTAFRFRSDGSTTLTSAATVTLHLVNNPPNGTTLPANWFSLQIDPVTGRTQFYRP